ncbi:LysE family transporter [Hyperthermus butylicus]|uniref:Conserved archaeal protein n=1 Tax=Hyperthermus butylicus (strain DSM 5456 / JCM 9403 / PLM1-5) TaxID=415426 RepID=A2BKW4_HYPBU|nr:LysE family transporter [Hyperthermus butylicus]ABM80625.1 conserved archaeal protein [Hyperthermus butylicus DSM 5456]
MQPRSAVTGRELRSIVITTLLVTPSGALSPGLLSASAIAVGVYLGAVGGLVVALGHMVFELPYVGLLVYWAERFNRVLRKLEKPLALLTLAAAAYFAAGLFETAAGLLWGTGDTSYGVSVGSTPTQAFVAGIVFTGGNPYFLAWWLTIGLPLVRGAASLGARGFAAMYLSHVWIDYAWLVLLAAAGGGLAGIPSLYAALLVALTLLLIVFAVDVALRAFTGKKLLPF